MAAEVISNYGAGRLKAREWSVVHNFGVFLWIIRF